MLAKRYNFDLNLWIENTVFNLYISIFLPLLHVFAISPRMERFIDFSSLAAVLNVCQLPNVTPLTIEIPTLWRTFKTITNNLFYLKQRTQCLKQTFFFIFELFLGAKNQWNRCAASVVRNEHKFRLKLYEHCLIGCNFMRKWCISTKNVSFCIFKWIHTKKWDAFLFAAHETLTEKIGYSEKRHTTTTSLVGQCVKQREMTARKNEKIAEMWFNAMLTSLYRTNTDQLNYLPMCVSTRNYKLMSVR